MENEKPQNAQEESQATQDSTKPKRGRKPKATQDSTDSKAKENAKTESSEQTAEESNSSRDKVFELWRQKAAKRKKHQMLRKVQTFNKIFIKAIIIVYNSVAYFTLPDPLNILEGLTMIIMLIGSVIIWTLLNIHDELARSNDKNAF